MKEITGNMLISDIIEMDIAVVDILLKHGMNCLGCPACNSESLAEAVHGHGANLELIVTELNDYFRNK